MSQQAFFFFYVMSCFFVFVFFAFFRVDYVRQSTEMMKNEIGLKLNVEQQNKQLQQKLVKLPYSTRIIGCFLCIKRRPYIYSPALCI